MSAARAAEGPLRVLVVEDEPDIRRLIETVLTDAGYAVEATGDPRAALGLARAQSPDLVLCDIAMPGMDGHQVLKALQEDPATAQCPLVFVTAQREFTERVEAFRSGAVDYLTKPFGKDGLLRKVERAISMAGRKADRQAAGAPGSTAVAKEPNAAPSSPGKRVIVREGAKQEPAAPPDDPMLGFLVPDDPGTQDQDSPDPARLQGSSAGVSFQELPEEFRRVLVVDDNEQFRDYLRRLMTMQGFVVHEAADGEAALALALEHRPWLILSDVAMPGVDGIELCLSVRRHTLIRHTPLIFLSGWDDYRERDRGLEAGADEFVSKHTPARELLIRIQVVLGRYVRLGATREKASSGMEGRLALVGAAGVLQMCHLGQLTGRLEAQSGEAAAEVLFRDGEIIQVSAAGLSAEPALLEYLSWSEGRFHFTPGKVGDAPAMGDGFSQLLLEACRKLDEGARG